MSGGVTAFLTAVGGTSLFCYLLMNRGQNRGVRRQRTSGDSAGSGASYDSGSSGSDGWNIFSWFSSDTSSSDSSGPQAVRTTAVAGTAVAGIVAAVVEMVAGAVINAATPISRKPH